MISYTEIENTLPMIVYIEANDDVINGMGNSTSAVLEYQIHVYYAHNQIFKFIFCMKTLRNARVNMIFIL